MTSLQRTARSRTANCRHQEGVALAILVWFLAAMSLLVAGIAMQARVDIKLAQLHLTQARVEAAADGAMQLALANLPQQKPGEAIPPVLPGQNLSVGGINVAVYITPVTGLIDINAAPEGLLFLLFSGVEEMDEVTARTLAHNVVEWRAANPSGEGAASQRGAEENNPRHARFEAIEDLLLVTGIDRRIFEAVEDAVYVGRIGQSGVDWVAAPVPVLRVLGKMDTASAQELADSRLAGAKGGLVAPQYLDLSFQEASQLSAYRVDAVAEVDGAVFNRRRWVDRSQPGSDGLPWAFFRTEALRVIGSSAAVQQPAGASVNVGS